MRLVAVFILTAFLGIAGCKSSVDNSDAPPSLLSRSWIPQDELPLLASRASDGDAAAAERLAMYYACIAQDRTKALHWWRVAASRGHLVATYNLGVLLWESHESASRAEALRWLHEAAKQGSKEAGEFLRLVVKEPNQSLEPTPTAGTSAAEQPLVPAAVVAHL